MTITIYPAAHAELMKDHAGEKYRPSNGMEGELFFDAWCRQCQRDRAMREDAPLEDCDDSERCDIIADTFAYQASDPQYPVAWQYGTDGQPRCIAFVEAGQPIPVLDQHTVDMFGDAQ